MQCNKHHEPACVGKMVNDVGTAIRKVLWCCFYLVWLLFWDSIPTWFFIFLHVFCNLLLLLFQGEKRSLQRCVVGNHDLIAENSIFSSDVRLCFRSQPTTENYSRAVYPLYGAYSEWQQCFFLQVAYMA